MACSSFLRWGGRKGWRWSYSPKANDWSNCACVMVALWDPLATEGRAATLVSTLKGREVEPTHDPIHVDSYFSLWRSSTWQFLSCCCLTFHLHFILCGCAQHGHMWRSEDNLQESVLSPTTQVPGIDIKSSSLATSVFTPSAILPPLLPRFMLYNQPVQ